jgi:hypothetical protein
LCDCIYTRSPGQSESDRNRTEATRGRGRGEESAFNGGKFSFGEDEKVLWVEVEFLIP